MNQMFDVDRNWMWRELLRPAQDGLCPICGKPLLVGGSLSIDHVLAKSHRWCRCVGERAADALAVQPGQGR